MKKSEAKAVRERWRQAVATVIAATRRDSDVTQAELAKRVSWSRDRLAKVETGIRRVEIGDIALIAEALNQTPEKILKRILGWMG